MKLEQCIGSGVKVFWNTVSILHLNRQLLMMKIHLKKYFWQGLEIFANSYPEGSKVGPKMYIIKVYHQSWKQMRSLENCSEENWHRRPLKCILNVSLSNVDKFVHSALLCYDSNVLKEPCRNIFWGNRSKTVIRSVNIYQLAFLEN